MAESKRDEGMVEQLLERIRTHEIRDAKTIAAVLYFHTWSQIGT